MCSSLSNISSILCLNEVIPAFRKDVMWALITNVVVLAQAFPEPPFSTDLPRQCLREGGEELSSIGGPQGVGRSSSLEAEAAPVWLGTSELAPSVQASDWIAGTYSGRKRGRHSPSEASLFLASLAQAFSLLYPFQLGTCTPFKDTRGATSGCSWWAVALKFKHSLT